MTSTATNSAYKVDQAILQQIERVELSPRLKREREEFLKREMEITAERAVLTMEAWQETQADVLDIRWAKLVQKWMERLPIVIFKDQLVVGSETKFFRGADPWVEYEAPTMAEIMEQGRQIRTSAARVSQCSEEDWAAIEDAVNFFLGKTPVDTVWKNMKALYGDWPEELERARGVMRLGRYTMGGIVPLWAKFLSKGLRGLIQEAEAGIERVRSGEEPDAKKAWFWQAVVIVCEAVIHFAHRYAQLARELAQDEPNPIRKKELERVAETCERVPEFPARTLQEAIQGRMLWGITMKLCYPNISAAESGRIDQDMYPYFISDIREHCLTVEQACELMGSFLSSLSRHDGVKNALRGQMAQGTLVTNVPIGGITSDGLDANNELTYLVLHMAGILKYAEPHYTFRVNAITPKWAMTKAIDTNRKVGGGQPQFMSDDRVISYLLKQGEDLRDARDWIATG